MTSIRGKESDIFFQGYCTKSWRLISELVCSGGCLDIATLLWVYEGRAVKNVGVVEDESLTHTGGWGGG